MTEIAKHPVCIDCGGDLAYGYPMVNDERGYHHVKCPTNADPCSNVEAATHRIWEIDDELTDLLNCHLSDCQMAFFWGLWADQERMTELKLDRMDSVFEQALKSPEGRCPHCGEDIENSGLNADGEDEDEWEEGTNELRQCFRCGEDFWEFDAYHCDLIDRKPDSVVEAIKAAHKPTHVSYDAPFVHDDEGELKCPGCGWHYGRLFYVPGCDAEEAICFKCMEEIGVDLEHDKVTTIHQETDGRDGWIAVTNVGGYAEQSGFIYVGESE